MTISSTDLINRLKAAAVGPSWDKDKKKIRELYLIFRDEAIAWLKSLEGNEDCNNKTWEPVKAAILLNYGPRITARTTCTNLADMPQRPGQVANRYHRRLFATFNKLKGTLPAERKAVRFILANATAAGAALQI